jgi:hypothetical protein
MRLDTRGVVRRSRSRASPFAWLQRRREGRPSARVGAVAPPPRHRDNLRAGIFTVRRAYAKGRLKEYPKTARSRRRVPLRSRVVAGLRDLPRRRGILFPNALGRRIGINVWRSRHWTPALAAAGVKHRRIHEYADSFVMPTSSRNAWRVGLIAA